MSQISDKLDVPQIDRTLAVELAKLSRSMAGATDVVKHGPTTRQIVEILAETGFPRRHREQLENGLHGPSGAKAMELLPRILAGDCMLLLIGARGPGKTQMATFWASELIKAKFAKTEYKPGIEKQWSGCYRKTADMIGEIKTTWHDGGSQAGTENDLLKKYRSKKYLVLDEFHERGSSDWEGRTLVNIIDHRYDEKLVTILIANLSESEAKQQLNPSILSRCEEIGGIVPCNWGSYRSAGL